MEIKKIKLNMAPLKHIVEKEGDIRSAMVQTMSIYVATLFCCEFTPPPDPAPIY